MTIMTRTKEIRIEEIKACAMDIIENAEDIYGTFEHPKDLRIIIDIKSQQDPVVMVERTFISKRLISYYTEN